MLNNLIAEYTTGEDFICPKDYYMSIATELKDIPYTFNGEKCNLFIEVNNIYYSGRKRKNITDYPQVITINVYDKNDCSTDFETICKIAKEKYTPND